MASGRPILSREREVPGEGGESLWILESKIPIADEAGEVTGLVSMAKDITEHKRSQEALRRSEARYRALFDQAHDAIILENEQEEIVDANRATCELLGYTQAELKHMRTPDLEPPEIRALPTHRIYTARDLADERCFETVVAHRTGARIPVEITIAPLEVDGQVLFLSIIRDISKRKRAEEEIRRRTAQLEALREVGLDITAQLDLDDLLRSIVSRAIDLLGGTVGGLDLYRPERDVLEFAVTIGLDSAPSGVALRRGEGLAGKVWESDEPLIVDDYAHWEEHLAVWEGHHAPAAMVGVPVRWGEKFLGVLTVGNETPNSLSHADAKLLSLFATQAAIAIRNAHLLQTEREQRDLAEALGEAATAVNSALDMEQVLDCILEQVERVVAGDAFNIMLVDEDDIARTVRWRGYEHMGAGERIVNYSTPVAAYASLARMTRDGNPAVVIDTTTDPDWVPAEGWEWLRSYVGAPIRVDGATVGFLNVDGTQPGQFGAADGRQLEAFAAHAAIAIRNARLHRQVLDHARHLEKRVRERTAEIQAQYARLEAIMQSTADGIVATDAEGEILQANAVAQTWLTRTLCPEDARKLREAVQELARQLTADRTDAGVGARSPRPTTEKRPKATLELTGLDLELKASAVSAPETKEAATVVAIHDVSHLKALDRMKTQFVSNVSHELRTPVTTIKLYAYLMRKKPEEWETYLAPLVREANYQARLVEDILQISRIDAGRLAMKPQPTALNELVKRVVVGHRVLARERGLTLIYHPTRPSPVALVDTQRMQQVLDNLVSNAIRYTPEGGDIVVATDMQEAEGRAWALATVTDTGIGIPGDELPQIFDRFFRGVKPQKMQISGTGLGLSIAKEIVELHGGRVTVESEEGAGSTFTVWLPVGG